MRVLQYSRIGFRRRRRNMLPGKRFCVGGLCPIAAIYLSDEECVDCAKGSAVGLDYQFVCAIDKVKATTRQKDWRYITAKKALAVLDSLSA